MNRPLYLCALDYRGFWPPFSQTLFVRFCIDESEI